MTKVYPTVVALITLLLLTWPLTARAHVPEAPEVGAVTTVCTPEAQAALLDVVRAQGAENSQSFFDDQLRARQCRKLRLPVWTKIITANEPFRAPDNYWIYPLQIEPLVTGGPLSRMTSTIHVHKIKGIDI